VVTWALDADVVIYASTIGHRFQQSIARLLAETDPGSLYGSVLLLPEVLIKPTRLRTHERLDVVAVLAQLQLIQVTEDIGRRAVQLGARYGLKTPDAVHLATAAAIEADRFLTNNRNDFKADRIREVEIVFPQDLPAA
jgi:predicted nucleic acid-binding protein